MKRTIEDLPIEVLCDIFQQLDLKSRKNARQVRRRWGQAGARRLYHRVYFAPNYRIMEVFDNITSEPAFANGVTELVYDARMFWRYWTKPGAHYGAHIKYNDSENRTELDEESPSFRDIMKVLERSVVLETGPSGIRRNHLHRANKSRHRYEQLFAEQTYILDSKLDLGMLCQGLQMLPGLKTVSILYDFDRRSEIMNLHVPASPWYRVWSSAIWEDTLPPLSWPLYWEITREPSYVDFDDGLPNLFVDYPWDWRGIANLFRAISPHGSRIRHLQCGSQYSAVPLYILNDSSIASNFQSVATNLEFLKFNCEVVRPRNDQDVLGLEVATLALSVILAKAQKLTALSVSTYMPPPVWQRTFGAHTWPGLSVLELSEMNVDLDMLKAICQRNKDTLQDLRLQNIHLACPNLNVSWQDVGRELGSFLRLRRIGLYDLTGSAYLRPNGDLSLGVWTRSLGDLLMRWIPKPMLSIHARSAEWIFMWHDSVDSSEFRWF